MNLKNKSGVGVIVGRFQVHDFTEGHIELINYVKSLHTKVIIFLGVARIYSQHDSLDFIARKQMVFCRFPSAIVLPILDCESNDVWSSKLDDLIQSVGITDNDITLYGGRDSFIKKYSGKYKTIELNMPGDAWKESGTLQRERAAQIPENSPLWRAGVIWARYNDFPKVISTVDVAVWRRTEKYNTFDLLVGRKKDEQKWRLPGGFTDPKCDSDEDDAMREVVEETGLSGMVMQPIQYIGSFKIDDYRYRNSQDKVRTHLFIWEGTYQEGWTDNSTYCSLSASDDLEEVKWLNIGPDTDWKKDIAEVHVNLVQHATLKIQRKILLTGEKENNG